MPSSDIKTTRRIYYFPADRHRIRRLIDSLTINSIFIFICYRSLWFLLIDRSSLFELVINNSGDVHEMFAGWVLDILFTSPFKAPFLCILIIRKGMVYMRWVCAYLYCAMYSLVCKKRGYGMESVTYLMDWCGVFNKLNISIDEFK